MTYTRDEIRAYAQSFACRMMAGDESAYFEFALFLDALNKVQIEVPRI